MDRSKFSESVFIVDPKAKPLDIQDAISRRVERIKSMAYIGQDEDFTTWDAEVTGSYFAGIVEHAEAVQLLLEAWEKK